MSYTLGIDLGSSKISYAVGDQKGRILEGVFTTETEAKNLVPQLRGLEEEAESLADGEIENVGVATTGLLDRQNNVIKKFDTRDFKVLKNIDLEKAFGSDKTIWLENDANAAALGEYYKGAGKDTDHLIRIVMGTGIGAGIISGGKLVKGAGSAGEIGKMKISNMFEQDSAVSEGSWESFSSGRGLKNLVEKVSSGENIEHPREIFERARTGDKEMLEVLEHFQEMNLRGVAAVTNFLHPEKVVFGGSVAMENQEEVIGHLQENLDDYIYVEKPELEPTQLEQRAELEGALRLPRKVQDHGKETK